MSPPVSAFTLGSAQPTASSLSSVLNAAANYAAALTAPLQIAAAAGIPLQLYNLAATAGGATSMSSPTVTLSAAAPSWISAGQQVIDFTTGHFIGVVGSVSGSTVTLAANALFPVAANDVLNFSGPVPGWSSDLTALQSQLATAISSLTSSIATMQAICATVNALG
jgi:hypothetical protein